MSSQLNRLFQSVFGLGRRVEDDPPTSMLDVDYTTPAQSREGKIAPFVTPAGVKGTAEYKNDHM